MASLSQCENGHFFDMDMYPRCPYCNGLSGIVNRTVGTDDNSTKPISAVVSATYFSSEGSIPTAPVKIDSAIETVPPSGDPDKDLTVVVRPGEKESHPDENRFVVGWLAAVEGPYQGKSFELHFGYNRVGRNEGDIRLEKDSTISRVNHFRIVYDNEENHFLFFAGDSDNYPKVNGEKKYDGERSRLTPYSVIEAGHSKFIFVPLCSDQFIWQRKES